MRVLLVFALGGCSSEDAPEGAQNGAADSAAQRGVIDGLEIGDHSTFHPGFDPNVPDNDHDWWSENFDCNDRDTNIHPGAVELDEDIDEDCDGFADEREGDDPAVLCEDLDGDGFGSQVCGLSDGVNNDDDCDDRNPAVVPNRDEQDDNELDDDCDGLIDERYYEAALCARSHTSVVMFELFAASFNNPNDGTYVSPEDWDVRTWSDLETEVTGSVSRDEAPELFVADDHEKYCAPFPALEGGGMFIVNGLALMNDGRVRVLDSFTSDPPSLISVWVDGETVNCTNDGYYHLCSR